MEILQVSDFCKSTQVGFRPRPELQPISQNASLAYAAKPAVDCLPIVLRSVRTDADESAGFGHADHFPKGFALVREQAEAHSAEHSIKRIVCKGEVFCIQLGET